MMDEPSMNGNFNGNDVANPPSTIEHYSDEELMSQRASGRRERRLHRDEPSSSSVGRASLPAPVYQKINMGPNRFPFRINPRRPFRCIGGTEGLQQRCYSVHLSA
jgi:hypothetical protein